MSFINEYESIKKAFEVDHLFTLIIGENKKVEWPNSSGVYVIWRNNTDSIDNLIYVGMTGKFKRTNPGAISFNKALFKNRVSRWTPYRFCDSELDNALRYSFRYGPKTSNSDKQSKIKYDLDAYHTTVPYTELEIHCFHINSNHEEYTPILLESFFLTKYLKSNGSLPPANNEL